MKEDTRNSKALQRRDALLSLLHSRPLSYEQIIEAQDKQGVLEYDRFENHVVIEKQKFSTFHRDLKSLRGLGYKIKCNRSTGIYSWANSPFGLHFTDNQLTAFGLLLDTFRNEKLLHADRLQELLRHLTNLLSTEQQHLLANRRASFVVNLKETTDYRNTDPTTLEAIERAIRVRQQLEFSYTPGRDDKVRRHVVEPRPLVYEDGHVYLRAYSLDWNDEYPFRLDAIIPGSARVLPTTIAPSRPSSGVHLLQYWLSPVIARKKVSQHFDGQEVERHDDGSATVTAYIKKIELFGARRLLLSYGENCRVINPPELVVQFQVVAEKFYQMYCKPGQ